MKRAAGKLAALAATLPKNERPGLVENIFPTLNKLDPGITAAWAVEAQDRLAAYERGELAAVSEEEVFGDRGGR